MPRPGTRSTARSRFGSNATSCASRRRLSGVSTRVRVSPATTCALVTIRLSATTKPVPSCRRSHATPSTLTTDARTRAATFDGMPESGGDPASGDVSVSNTSGKVWSPTRRPSVSACSGGLGATLSIARASAELRTACAGQPGELASAGMSSHTTTRIPAPPATAPAMRSVRCTPGGIFGARRPCARLPIASPMPWQIVATTNTKPSATSNRVRGGEPLSASATLSTSATATTRPRIRPAHESMRRRKPSRYPRYAAPATASAMTRSRKFTPLTGAARG